MSTLLFFSEAKAKGAEESDLEWGKLKHVEFEVKQVEVDEVQTEVKKVEQQKSQTEISKRRTSVLVCDFSTVFVLC